MPWIFQLFYNLSLFMNWLDDYKNLDDCLNSIQEELFNIDDSVSSNDNDLSLSVEILKLVLLNIKTLFFLKGKSHFYTLEQRREQGAGGYSVPYYTVVDKKGVERFRVSSKFFYNGLVVKGLDKYYNCSKIALRKDLITRNINRGSLFVKDYKGQAKGLIYEDDSDAFLIVYGSINANSFEETLAKRELISVSFTSDNVIEMYCWHDKRRGYLKGTEYTTKVEVKIPEWEIISDVITNEEDYNLK